MVITWHGFSCFKIEGQKSSIILDRFDASGGLRVPKMSGDVVAVTSDKPLYNNYKGIKTPDGNTPFIIQGAGEYEVKEIFVYGIHPKSEKDAKKNGSVFYRIEIDGMSVASLGSLDHDLTDADLELLEGVDILLVPVGGKTTLDAKGATKLISQIEPRMVIPMHYKVLGVKGDIQSVDAFQKEVGAGSQEVLPKLRIAKKDLPSDKMGVVILKV